MALKGALLTLAAGVFTLVTGSALADTDSGNFNFFLKGKYRENASIDCATGATSDEIGTSSLPIHVSFTGVVSYDGNGNVTVAEHGIVIGAGQPGTFDENCIGTYSVNRNGSFSRESKCTATDNSYTLSGIKWKGQIGEEGMVLSMSQAERVEQTLVGPGLNIKRICGGVSTQVRIQRP
ncbi:MAG TPA: hypothetical protein VJT11_13490 [Nitrospiraceae bacterium]|nr:hypothetical protein [Nitrospiraceae bacterium]